MLRQTAVKFVWVTICFDSRKQREAAIVGVKHCSGFFQVMRSSAEDIVMRGSVICVQSLPQCPFKRSFFRLAFWDLFSPVPRSLVVASRCFCVLSFCAALSVQPIQARGRCVLHVAMRDTFMMFCTHFLQLGVNNCFEVVLSKDRSLARNTSS